MTLAGATGAGDEYWSVLFDETTGGEIGHERSIERWGASEIETFHRLVRIDSGSAFAQTSTMT